MNGAENDYTTLAVRRDTRDRFADAKPFESMSADEFVDVLLERWEGRR